MSPRPACETCGRSAPGPLEVTGLVVLVLLACLGLAFLLLEGVGFLL